MNNISIGVISPRTRARCYSTSEPFVRGDQKLSLEGLYSPESIATRLSNDLLGNIKLEKARIGAIADEYPRLLEERLEITLRVQGKVQGVFMRGTIDSIAEALKMSDYDKKLNIENLPDGNTVEARFVLNPFELFLLEKYIRPGKEYTVVCAGEDDLKAGRAVIHQADERTPRQIWRSYLPSITSVSWSMLSRKDNLVTLNQTGSSDDEPSVWAMFWQNLVLSGFDTGDFGEFHPSRDCPNVWNLFPGGPDHAAIMRAQERAIVLGVKIEEAP
ncbi:MAG: hypothetical protein FD145_1019 [Candidatus Saganbacteria bacterium]|uniref:Uncharacterized protein n=1 Tax=Candidatus Saganbacteria bacterium TaxID=2575572 RepID=A0A833NYE2_UNCSA|nr:MAG: hypothetical protein FD145_1019 [Candidatus Saganbacteria bacterium]